MVYTEIRKGNNKYYYRVKSVRQGEKFRKERVYLGINLSKKELLLKEMDADKILIPKKENKKLEVMGKIIPQIKKILIKRKVKKAGIFGSYAEGDYKKNSDIDILIEPPKGIGFGLAGIQMELEEKLNKKVDLVSYKGISPYLREVILRQEVRIL